MAPMCGVTRPDAKLEQLALVARQLLREPRGEIEELEAEDVHALQQDEVERDARITPDAYPTVTNLPPPCSARKAGSARSPPTGSTTTSAPSGRAARSLARSSPARWFTKFVAPSCFATSSFSSLDATAVTVAPSSTPSCTAARPTPPPAPKTMSCSPGCTPPQSEARDTPCDGPHRTPRRLARRHQRGSR